MTRALGLAAERVVMAMSTGTEALIRLATPSDALELARLRWDSRVEGESNHSRAGFLRDCEVWLGDALASGRWVAAVAESEPGSLCGCMFLQSVAKVPVPGATHREWGYVTNSFVDSQRRGQGIGQRLLHLLIEAGEDRRLEFLIVWPSERAVPFYRRAGFRPVSDVHARPDEPPLELLLSARNGS